MRGAALLEAGLGGVLMGAAVHRRRPTGSILGGMVAVGAFLLVDVITKVSLTSQARHRELRRRADEEMALVAEEFGTQKRHAAGWAGQSSPSKQALSTLRAFTGAALAVWYMSRASISPIRSGA